MALSGSEWLAVAVSDPYWLREALNGYEWI